MAFDLGMSLAFIAAGAATQVGALLLARRPIRLLRAGGSSRGEVLDNEDTMIEENRGPSSKFYFPLVGFTTAKGERIQFSSGIGRKKPLPMGTEVRVLYDPAKPDEAELATFKTLWLIPVVTAVFGLPFLVAGVYGLIFFLQSEWANTIYS